MRYCIEHRHVEIWYQPQIAMTTGRYLGAEALVRLRHPKQGVIAPCQFIPVAEQTGLIIPLGKQVLDHVCSHARLWLEAGIAIGRIGINVAEQQLLRGNFFATLQHAIEYYRLPAETLQIEITETFVMADPPETRRILEAIRALGVSIALDDFGTGQSSLSQLKTLPFDTLKIDRSFIANIPNDSYDVAITKAILSLGASLHLNVITEGIETLEQMEFMKLNGCNEGQGHLFSPPLQQQEFDTWLRKYSDAQASSPATF